MAKTVEGSSINLTDSLETIKGKMAKTPTDSGRGEKVPEKGGVATLLELVELFEGGAEREKYEKMYLGEGIRYSELKEKLAKAIYKEIEPIQKRRAVLEKDPSYVERVLEDGAKRARAVARGTLDEVKKSMGLI